MKTKTKFDSTSNARNLINSVVEKFPKGPERDGLQTKLREFYNCFVGAMRLPQGYDRSKVIEEGTQNLHAAQRIADRVDKQNGNAKFSTMISILASNLTDLKRGHSKTGKVEDNFYGKRVVKGIFAKAKFDKSNYYALEGTVDGNATGSKTVETIEEAMYYGKAMLEHMKKQSPKAKVATVHIFKVVNYQRENTPVKVLNSRTGTKAKFAKMSPEKVKILTEAVQQIVKEKPLITRKYYADHGLSEVRWAFDIFWAAQKKLPTNFLSDLYKDGLHDSHIQTVLKSALKSYSSRTGAKAKFAIKKIKDLGNGWVVEEATGNDAFNPSATELYLTKGSKTIPVESLKHAIETYNDLITGKKGIYK